MSKVVFKYELQAGVTLIKLPVGSKPLHVATQHDRLQMWVLIPKDVVSFTERFFAVFGTGHPFDRPGASHIGTVLTADGDYVLHVFEVDRPAPGATT